MRHRRLARLLADELDSSWDQRSRFGAGGKAARSALRRVAQPVTSRQARVDEAIRATLDELSLLGELSSLTPIDARDAAVLDTEIGDMLFHADDKVMTPWVREHRVWEPGETAFLRRTLQPGQVFVDCGANVGWHAVLGAQLVGPAGLVVAIEPEPRNLALLRANLWRHAPANTKVVPAAAGASRGLIELQLDEDNRGDHQTHPVGHGLPDRAARLVPMVRLDEVLGDTPVDMVKIDAQGFDHEVFAGLHGTLAASPAPTLMIEFWLEGMEQRGVSVDATLAAYRGAGYEVGLLADDGSHHPAGDDEVVQTAEDLGTRFVNLVLQRA